MPSANELNPETGSGRQKIVDEAKSRGETAAKTGYPHAVYRDQQGAMKDAEYGFTAWINDAVYDIKDNENRWQRWKSEVQRLFTLTFAGAYLEKVAEQDKKEGRSSGVPTASLATMQGATVRLTRVDRKANEYVYSLELSDPGNFEGVEKTEWVVYFEGAAEPAAAPARATASYGMAMVSDVVRSYGASTPQKSVRRPKGSYLRSP